MQLLRTLFWVAIAVAASAFVVANWTPITLTLWNGVLLDTYLPIPLTAAFLLGFVPYYLLHSATRWSLQRSLLAIRPIGSYRVLGALLRCAISTPSSSAPTTASSIASLRSSPALSYCWRCG